LHVIGPRLERQDLDREELSHVISGPDRNTGLDRGEQSHVNSRLDRKIGLDRGRTLSNKLRNRREKPVLDRKDKATQGRTLA
jgi:hypothetical protein